MIFRPQKELIIDTPKKPKNDNEYFEVLSKAVFRAGFSWEVVELKWPNIKKGFIGFDIKAVSRFDHRDIDRLLTDPKMIRNGRKIKATIDNANILKRIIRDYGSVRKFIKSLRKLSYGDKNKLLTKTFRNIGRTSSFVFLWSVREKVPSWAER